MTNEIYLYIFWTAVGLLFYGFVGYPLLMALFGGRHPQAAEELPELPTVSLLIAAHNEDVVIRDKLNNALALDYPEEKLEILLGSDGSSDGTNEIAASFTSPRIQFFAFQKRRGKPSVLNDLAKQASGDVLMLCDANVMFDAQSLRLLVAHFANPKIGAVTGDVRIASCDADFGEGESLYYQVERRIQLGESYTGSVMGVDGGMYVLRRELFKPLLPQALNDDFVLSMQVIQCGCRIAYEPAAFANETSTPTARQEWRRRVRVSAGAIQLLKWCCWPPLTRPIELWQFASHKFLRWLTPFLLVCLLVSNIAVASVHWVYQVSLGLQIALYVIAAAATVSLRFRESKLGGIPFYFVMSYIAMVVGMFHGLLNRQQVKWKQADRMPTAHDHVA